MLTSGNRAEGNVCGGRTKVLRYTEKKPLCLPACNYSGTAPVLANGPRNLSLFLGSSVVRVFLQPLLRNPATNYVPPGDVRTDDVQLRIHDHEVRDGARHEHAEAV